MLTLILCALVLSTPACAQNENDETFRQIYYLQFVGIKTAMTSSSGAFFLDSQQGKLNRFKEVARKVAPESYVEGIQVKNIPDLNSVLFIFRNRLECLCATSYWSERYRTKKIHINFTLTKNPSAFSINHNFRRLSAALILMTEAI
jgi:hypothetical protein